MSDDPLCKVLLVEDDSDSAEAMMSVLEIHGVEVLWSVDAPGSMLALDSIRQRGDRAVDFLLLDLNLPHTDALQLARDLKERTETLPIILLSAASAQTLEESAQAMGAIAALRKPFSVECLLNLLREHLPRREEEPGFSRRAAAR